MTFTVKSLLDVAAIRTTSLTPGVGEAREIVWAHVCELPDPWRWLGAGALVMTTGISLPATTDEQCDYILALHEAGIAALAIDSEMLQASLTRPTLAFASQIGFPILDTAHEVPFVAVAMAVSDGVRQEGTLHAHATEQMYLALGGHLVEAPIEALLRALEPIMGGSLRLESTRAEQRADPDQATQPTPGRIAQSPTGTLSVVLAGAHAPRLVWDGYVARIGLLQHAAGIVGSALALKLASRRAEWLHGSLLLSDLCEASPDAASATHLVEAYGITPPYVVAIAPSEHPRDLLDATHLGFASADVAALATIKDGQVIVLTQATIASDEVFVELAGDAVRIGVSAPFADRSNLGRGLGDDGDSGLGNGLQTALRQARSAVIRNHQSGNVLRFEEHEPTSLFLPQGAEQLRSIAQQVLGPLTTYDAQRGTSLTQTLQVFLEENRSWVRASERLYVHRQTLIARVSRIEKIIDRDLSSMEDAAECWLAVQAAIGCGDLVPSDAGGVATGDARHEGDASVAGADAPI